MVRCIAIDDEPGALSKALDALNENQIGIDYIYAFVGRTQSKALVILRVEGSLEEAGAVLSKAGIQVLKDTEVYSI